MARVFDIDGSWRDLWEDPAMAARVDGLQTEALKALANLELADDNWATLTAAQKDAAARLSVRVCAALIRLRLGMTT